MRVYKITSMREYRADLNMFCDTYKTVAAKKSFLTRERKSVQELLCDFQQSLDNAKSKGEVLGWLHGERIHNGHVTFAKNMLAAIDEKYKSLA